jgi:hypothetical protein
MSKKKISWLKPIVLFLFFDLVVFLSGWWYLFDGRLRLVPSKAASLAVFTVAPVTNNVDNLVGQTGASWQFTFQTTTALQAGDLVQIIFPDTSSMNMPPFELFNISVSAATSTGETSLRFGVASTTVMGTTVSVPVISDQASTSLPFTITVSGVGNPLADMNNLPPYLTWGGQTTAGDGQAVIDGPATADSVLVRRGDMLRSWNFALSDYSASATGVEFSFTFTASTSLNVGEKINVNFPSNFNISNATTSDQIIVAGGLAQISSVNLSTTTDYGLNSVILTISGGSIDPAATSTVSFKIGNIANPVKGAYNGLSIYTTTANGGLVDGNFYGVEQSPDMMGPPPVDSIQIGGANTITGMVKVRRADGSLETVTPTEAAQIKVGMDCPEKMFFVGTKLINSDGTFTYDHLLDARYMLFVMPANTGEVGSFFMNYLQPAMIGIDVSDGQTVNVQPTFIVPDSVILTTVTGAPSSATDGFVRAYNGISESYTPIFSSPDYSTEGFSATGTGYIKVPVKSGYTWHLNLMSNNVFSASSYEYWPPTFDPVNILAGTATTTLPAQSFVLADKTLNVHVQDIDGNTLDENHMPSPCVAVRRQGADMMERGEPICQTTAVGSEHVYQAKVPSGAYMVEVMMPGAGVAEKSVTVTGTTTIDVIIAAPSNYISGTITDSDGFAIQGAAVFAQGSSGVFANAMTDSSGVFRLYVQPGVYSLDAFVPGYGQLSRKINVVVTDTANATEQNWTLDTGDFAVISGRVYVDTDGDDVYDTGEGVEGAKMFAHNPNTDQGSFAVTLPDGQYTLRVPKGSGYTVGGFSDIVGDLPPLTDVDASSNINNQNFSLPGLGTLAVTISGGANVGTSDFFLQAINSTNGRGNGTQAWAASGTDLVASINLPAGIYEIHLGTPLYGDLIDLPTNQTASTTTITANATTNLNISLPTMVTVSGTVTNGAGATVWISRIDGPGQYSTTAATNTSFSLKVPSGHTYDIGASLPGYINTPLTLINLNTATTVTLSLTAAAGTVSGTLTGNGTALSEGFIWAEKQGNDGWVGTEVNADGSYSLSIGSGTWKVYADGPCYYQSDGVNVTGSQTVNIDLTARPNCSLSRPTVQSITPTTGGAIKKMIGSSSVEVNIPANALGTDSNNVTVTVNQPGVLPPATPAAFPVEGAAVSISAANSSGSSIASLNNSVNITITYQEDALPAGSDENNLQLAFWNPSTQTWDTVAASVDTENNTITASVSHFTDFAPILPTASGVPDTPNNFTVSKYSSSGSDTKLNLSWDRVDGATGYYIYRDTSPSGSFPLLTTISSGSTVSYTDTGLSGGTTYYYKITAKNSNGESAASTAASTATCASVEHGTVSGSSCVITCDSGYTLSGGSCIQSGGGSSGLFNSGITEEGTGEETSDNEEENSEEESFISEIKETVKDVVKTVKKTINTWQEKIKTIISEAAQIYEANINVLVKKFGFKRDLAREKLDAKKYVRNLISDYISLADKHKYALINFVTYGTPTTKFLGEGERAGVLNSYKAAFSKLPATENEWSDVIKIANGRWPSERNEQTEANAKEAFRKIYLRDPDRENPHDDAAVTIIAYGLRPSQRNLDSEKTAIRIFKTIYGYWPQSAEAWDIVRAIAYSGAIR